jgi:hypothetical protein
MNLAGAVAFRAGLLDREETLLHAHLTAAVAGRAGLRLGARLGACALQGSQARPWSECGSRFGAARGLFERDFEVVAQVGAAIDVGASAAAAAAAAAENFAEDVAEGIGRNPRAAARRRPCLRVDAGVAVLVVGRAFLSVGQDFVGFLGFLELVFRFLDCPDCGPGDASSPACGRPS